MIKSIKAFFKTLPILIIGVSCILIGASASAYAEPSGSNPLTLKSITSEVGHTVSETAHLIQDISLIAGIGFILVSLFKFHQHKLNPTQVPISQGLTLLVIGAALTLFPRLVPTAGSALVGTKAHAAGVQKEAWGSQFFSN